MWGAYLSAIGAAEHERVHSPLEFKVNLVEALHQLLFNYRIYEYTNYFSAKKVFLWVDLYRN